MFKELWKRTGRSEDREAHGETIEQLLDRLSAVVDERILQYETEKEASFKTGSCKLAVSEESALKVDICLFFQKEGLWEEISMSKKFPADVLLPAEMDRLTGVGMEYPIVHPNGDNV